MKHLTEIFILAVLVDKLKVAKQKMLDTETESVAVDIIAVHDPEGFQTHKVVEYFMLQNETRSHSTVSLEGVQYASSVWDEIINPNLNDVAEDIMDEFNVTEPYSIKFDYDSSGDFCMLLVNN